MDIFDFLFGRPLASDEEAKENVGPGAGVPIFGLDALSSAAYGPEAALTILLPLGAAGIVYILPISASIIVLLAIVYFSYLQTIASYPRGGGSYTVAGANLGQGPGLLAGAALMVDYILDVAVGISAGVGALVSGVPRLQPHTLGLCLAILGILTLINMRGAREAGVAFMLPTYAFVGCLLTVIGMGTFEALRHAGHPAPVIPPPALPAATAAVSAWLIIRAFAGGCTALTGVEAVSNGVMAFREPRSRNAQTTLTILIGMLIILLAGIAWLVHVYGIGATDPGQPGYQSVLSELISAVMGRGVFYYGAIGSIVVVLALSANTAFADFPRLCRVIAQDGYLPYGFTVRGRRLVYTWGILALVFFAGLLLVIFGGVTDRLIPLFAIGAFTAFTLSQAGMVMHWRREGGRGARSSMFINGLGAVATGITTLVVLVAKFTEGAWITVLLIPLMITLMVAVHRHYVRLRQATAIDHPFRLQELRPPLVVLPIERCSRISEKALRFAYTLSQEVYAVHIQAEEDPERGSFQEQWAAYATEAARKAGLAPPALVVLKSPYRYITQPILNFVLDLERQHPDRQVAVLIPELIETHWYNYLLHNQRPAVLKALLYLKGTKSTIVINVPWYLQR